MFSTRSRYYSVADATYQDASGRQINYKVLRHHAGDKRHSDTHRGPAGPPRSAANSYYADPEQFWRICDGNNALYPDDLTQTAGASILIPVVQR